MKKILILSILITSCSRKVYVGNVHVHFYDHMTCEWSCLYMNDTLISKKEWKELNTDTIKINK